MHNKVSVLAILSGLLSLPGFTKAQGCSDAGFCSIGGLKAQHAEHDATGKKKNQQLSVLLPVGVGDDNVTVFTPGLQYDNQLSARWAIQAKLTANFADGPLGNASGGGDFFLTGIYQLPAKSEWITQITLGAKLPLNNGNLKSGGRALPMQYQSSLGTTDLIAGITVSNQRWQFAAGWQQPLSGANSNGFLPSGAASAKYAPSNAFTRKPDALIRAAYNGHAGTRFSYNTGLLAILHLGEDSYLAANNTRTAIENSGGLTLNLTAGARWAISKTIDIGLTAGTPLVVREVRPDGLTRKFIVSPEIAFHF